MNDIKILVDELVKFRNERNWSQFHNTNGEKYPVEKSKGTAKKYNEL